VPHTAVAAALDWGVETLKNGTVHYWVTAKAIARAAREGVDIRAYRGAYVVATHRGVVITDYVRSES
jgi:hypothetical protein